MPATNTASNRVRSFIRRQGRLTQGQQSALQTYEAKYCLDPSLPYDFSEHFGRNAPRILEIGFGNGDSLAEMARNNPGTDFIGVEVHRPGVGHLLMKLEQWQLTNVRIFCHDAVEVLEKNISDQSLNGIHLFFPDPWPKRKHHKRRIVQPGFVEILINKLQPGGYFHAATDWPNYAESMLSVLSGSIGLSNSSPTLDYCPRPMYRPQTKFERRGLALGHPIRDLIFFKENN